MNLYWRPIELYDLRRGKKKKQDSMYFLNGPISHLQIQDNSCRRKASNFFFAGESFSRKFFSTHSNILADIFEQYCERWAHFYWFMFTGRIWIHSQWRSVSQNAVSKVHCFIVFIVFFFELVFYLSTAQPGLS